MSRITEKDLEAVVDRINRVTSSPPASYVKDVDGKLVAQVGNYHLSYAYGGVSLHRMVEGGGETNVFRCGHVPKRELYVMMQAFLDGWADAYAVIKGITLLRRA